MYITFSQQGLVYRVSANSEISAIKLAEKAHPDYVWIGAKKA